MISPNAPSSPNRIPAHANSNAANRLAARLQQGLPPDVSTRALLNLRHNPGDWLEHVSDQAFKVLLEHGLLDVAQHQDAPESSHQASLPPLMLNIVDVARLDLLASALDHVTHRPSETGSQLLHAPHRTEVQTLIPRAIEEALQGTRDAFDLLLSPRLLRIYGTAMLMSLLTGMQAPWLRHELAHHLICAGIDVRARVGRPPKSLLCVVAALGTAEDCEFLLKQGAPMDLACLREAALHAPANLAFLLGTGSDVRLTPADIRQLLGMLMQVGVDEPSDAEFQAKKRLAARRLIDLLPSAELYECASIVHDGCNVLHAIVQAIETLAKRNCELIVTHAATGSASVSGQMREIWSVALTRLATLGFLFDALEPADRFALLATTDQTGRPPLHRLWSMEMSLAPPAAALTCLLLGSGAGMVEGAGADPQEPAGRRLHNWNMACAVLRDPAVSPEQYRLALGYLSFYFQHLSLVFSIASLDVSMSQVHQLANVEMSSHVKRMAATLRHEPLRRFLNGLLAHFVDRLSKKAAEQVSLRVTLVRAASLMTIVFEQLAKMPDERRATLLTSQLQNAEGLNTMGFMDLVQLLVLRTSDNPPPSA